MNKENNVVLKKARDTYGNKNQIMVCVEELAELICVLTKFPRYADESHASEELYEKVLDEAADVTVILEHVKSIFSIPDKALEDRVNAKIARVDRWLEKSNSMEQTLKDRNVELPSCKNM